MSKNQSSSKKYFVPVFAGFALGYVNASVLYSNYVKSAGANGIDIPMLLLAVFLLLPAVWLLVRPTSGGAAGFLAIALILSLIPILGDLIKGGGVDPVFAPIAMLPLLLMLGTSLIGVIVAISLFRASARIRAAK